jgi:hypothetical protein
MSNIYKNSCFILEKKEEKEYINKIFLLVNNNSCFKQPIKNAYVKIYKTKQKE